MSSTELFKRDNENFGKLFENKMKVPGVNGTDGGRRRSSSAAAKKRASARRGRQRHSRRRGH